MVSFAQRMGLRPVRSLIQTDALDDETRTELWNIVLVTFRTVAQKEMSYEPASSITSSMWAWEFKKPRDEQPDDNRVWGQVKTQVLTGQWFDALDILEAYVGYLERFTTWHSNDATVTADCGLRGGHARILPRARAGLLGAPWGLPGHEKAPEP